MREQLSENEQLLYEEFSLNHKCPDKKAFENYNFETKLHFSWTSGIGKTVVVECQRCFCKQDISDYENW